MCVCVCGGMWVCVQKYYAFKYNCNDHCWLPSSVLYVLYNKLVIYTIYMCVCVVGCGCVYKNIMHLSTIVMIIVGCPPVCYMYCITNL